VVYCDRCGAENKAGAKFCESCGAPLPKVERAPVEKREVPEAPVRYPAGRPRAGLIAVIAIVGIVVLIGVLLLTGTFRLGEAGPEDVVRDYAAAVGKGDFAKARELSTGDAMATYNNTLETNYNTIKTSYPNFTYRIEILELRVTSKTDNEATLYIKERETVSNAGPYNASVEYSGNVYLIKVGGKWKISNIALT